MRKLSLVVAGVMVGMIVASVVPAVAHHSPSYRRLANRVANLENRLYDVEGTLRSHQTAVTNLQAKTQFMDSQGYYTASVWDTQVISDVCQDGDDAVWRHLSGDPAGLQALSCTVGAYQRTDRQTP